MEGFVTLQLLQDMCFYGLDSFCLPKVQMEIKVSVLNSSIKVLVLNSFKSSFFESHFHISQGKDSVFNNISILKVSKSVNTS